jgi:hypothetical protein
MFVRTCVLRVPQCFVGACTLILQPLGDGFNAYGVCVQAPWSQQLGFDYILNNPIKFLSKREAGVFVNDQFPTHQSRLDRMGDSSLIPDLELAVTISNRRQDKFLKTMKDHVAYWAGIVNSLQNACLLGAPFPSQRLAPTNLTAPFPYLDPYSSNELQRFHWQCMTDMVKHGGQVRDKTKPTDGEILEAVSDADTKINQYERYACAYTLPFFSCSFAFYI